MSPPLDRMSPCPDRMSPPTARMSPCPDRMSPPPAGEFAVPAGEFAVPEREFAVPARMFPPPAGRVRALAGCAFAVRRAGLLAPAPDARRPGTCCGTGPFVVRLYSQALLRVRVRAFRRLSA